MEDPEHCLMVGDDLVNDMIAGKTGMKTFLTTDNIRFKNPLKVFSNLFGLGKGKDKVKPNYCGSLVQLQQILSVFD